MDFIGSVFRRPFRDGADWSEKIPGGWFLSNHPPDTGDKAAQACGFLPWVSHSASICSSVRPLVSGTSFHMKMAAKTLMTP